MKNLFRYFNLGVWLVSLVLFFSSCDQGPSRRRYVEFIDSKVNVSLEDLSLDPDNQRLTELPAQKNIVWDVPRNWIEKAGGGMRIISFESKKHKNIDVSIVSLGGMAGGADANISRWLGQLDLSEIDPKVLSQWKGELEIINSQGGYDLTLIDFTLLQKKASNKTASMMVAITKIDGNTVFVKMMGPLKEVKKNRESFRKLCLSLR